MIDSHDQDHHHEVYLEDLLLEFDQEELEEWKELAYLEGYEHESFK